jgi:hypothetical protein
VAACQLIQTEESYAGGSPGLYAPGGKFSRGSGSIEYTTDMGMPANPYRDRLARLPDLSHPALRQQFQGNNSADAQPIQGNNRNLYSSNLMEVGNT